jgi:outer membrane protein OmpA-like peptidoglycan-associated protein
MGVNLLSLLQEQFGGVVVEKLAGLIGVDKTDTQGALGSSLATILHGLVQKGSDVQGSESLIQHLQSGNYDGKVFDNLGESLSDSGTTENLMKSGPSDLKFIFGDKLSGIFDSFTTSGGIGKAGSSLLTVLTPLVLGFLGKSMKSQGISGAAGLTGMLAGQREFLRFAVPLKVRESLGSLPATPDASRSSAGGSATCGPKCNWKPWALLGLAAAAIIWFSMRSCDYLKPAAQNVSQVTQEATSTVTTTTAQIAEKAKEKAAPVVEEAVGKVEAGTKAVEVAAVTAVEKTEGLAAEAKIAVDKAAVEGVNALDIAALKVEGKADSAASADGNTALKVEEKTEGAVSTVGKIAETAVVATGDALSALGKFFSRKLPNGTELKIPESGVEMKLITFIEDPGQSVDKARWFSFDRLIFDTAKTTLKPESKEQLLNVAEIMKAYPKVTIKIGGYTDNVGNAAANLKLSQGRAEKVQAELVRLGVAATRMTAKGYGDQHPVADNKTEAGRALNRRTDINVTSK